MTDNIVPYSIENRMRDKRRIQSMVLIAFWVLVLLAITFLCSTAAHAQMNNQQWGFKPQNRASIAALMRQVEESENANAAQSASSDVDTLVCGGGGGSSSATANSTCIILNNSTAGLNVGQDSQGSQGAQSGEASGEEAPSIADDILEALGEN